MLRRSTKSNNKINWLKWLIIASFIVLPIVNVALIAILHRLPQGYDMQFHWQEMRELMKDGFLPRYAMNSFSESGVAVPTMYPYLFLYPFTLIYRISKSVTLTSYSFLVIDTFVALLISYFSSKKFSHNRVISYLFSIVYSMSFSLFLNSFQTDAIGMNFSFVFMPLVLFGFIYWIKNNQWKMLSIGMILIIYNSVIVSAYLILFLIIWTIIELWVNKKVGRKHLWTLCEAALLTILTTAIFWIPAAKLLLNNKLYDMLGDAGNQLNGVSIPKMIESSINTTLMINPKSWTYMMTISSLIGLIIGVIYYKKLSVMMRQMYWIAIVILLVSSNLFPWKFIAKTPFKVIQFPWRLYLIPQVFLAYLTAWFLSRLIKKWRIYKKYAGNKGILLSILVIVTVICGLQLSEQSTYISSIGHINVPASTLMNTRDVTKDYYPKAALPDFKNILDHEAVAGKKKIKVTPLGNGKYKLRSNRNLKNVQMPFVMYNGTKYRCEVNGGKVGCHVNGNQLLTMSSIKKGNHIIHTYVKPNILLNLLKYTLTIAGLLWIIWLCFCYKYGDKKCMKIVKKHKEIIASIIFIFIILLLIVTMFFIGYKNSISSKLEATAGLASVAVAFCGFMFAISIFNLRYNTSVRLICNYGNLEKSPFIVNFINESRISTSARFLGAFISKNQIKKGYDNNIGGQIPFPSTESSKKTEESTKYVGTLSNVNAHHSISFKVYLDEIIHMMNNNDYWNIFMNKIFRQKKDITLLFVFIDYKYKLSFDFITIPYKNSIYNEIFKDFNFKDKGITNIDYINNNNVDTNTNPNRFRKHYKNTFMKQTNIDVLKGLNIN